MNNTVILLICGCIVTLTSGISVYLFLKNKKIKNQNNVLHSQLKDFNSRINPLQLEVLEAKLNPHLFKNILNSIQSHAYKTYFAIDRLSNVLDYILYESRKELVSAKEEIEFALNLVEINKIKVSPLFDLKVKTKIKEKSEPLYDQRLMAPLVSIDLIENAFKHADIQNPDAFISITLEFKNSHFILTVSNTISPEPTIQKEKGGLGLKTLEQRLKIIYGENFELINYSENDVYFAQLKINLFEYKAKMLAVR